ncbi:hypothetical protein DAEQUDRAFT_800226 [Daedalea quercina L-15889]|uniref:Uncharacterized protein n=1 Tax=Daedalea quercina L-15889 TaxID=1314783 RepID=A0A165TAG3_9APHY|nr:hypothetical protein DAEQUDRAFT_800226 [Daedalea quercina L-15889]
MASTTAVVPTIPHDRPSAVRTNSTASTASSAGASLRRRTATRTRSILPPGKRGKSQGPSEGRMDTVDDDVRSFLEFGDSSPPVPVEMHAELEELVSLPGPPAGQSHLRTARSYHGAHGTTRETGLRGMMPGTSALGVAKKPWETRSEGGSVKGIKTRSRALSLPRQAFRANIASDSSSEPSPKTPGQETRQLIQVQTAKPGSQNPRDSMLSTTSSSLYPASTATGTFTESSFPYSIDDDLAERMTPVAPEIVSGDKSEFDADDVSYRLRLLVNNSYFLPPAHAKPSPFSLNPQTAGGQKVSPKPSAGAFLDFFRLGKSRSKPTTPSTSSPPAVEPPAPVLRTTSDSTTASGFVPRPHARSLPHTPIHSASAPSASRVVVVRERMDDLAAAAKEAEQDLRTRAVRKTRSQSITRPQPSHLDVIDPTDAVDLPPPSSGYPFAVQASAVYGVNVSGALGAAVLAEQLPPNSPGAWSSSTDDDAWRKALLVQAVHHSLTNSVDTSFASGSTDRSRLTSSAGPSKSGSSGHTSQPSDAFSQGTNFRSLSDPSKSGSSGHASQPSEAFSQGTHVLSLSGPSRDGSSGHASQPSESFSQATHSTPKQRVGQRILESLHVTIESNEPASPTTPTQAKAPSSANSQQTFSSVSSLAGQRLPRHNQSSPPGRAESPTQTAALAPPPRRPILNPAFSHSQPDLTDPDPESHGSSRLSSQGLRKVMSSPKLSESRETVQTGDVRATSPMSISQRLSMRISPVMLNVEAIPSRSSYRSFMSRLTSGSRASDDLSYVTPEDTDVDQTLHQRPSVTVSMVTEGRPSITTSEYSESSPTASAFHDAIFGSCRSPSALSRRSYLPEGSGHSRSISPVPSAVAAEGSRTQVSSPPPRVSVSSLAHTALAPPPRPSPRSSPRASPKPPPSPLRPPEEPHVLPASDRPFSIRSIGSGSVPTTSPESAAFPTSPQLLADRRGHAPPLALRVPEEFAPPAIHSAPAPSSPADFFDQIESTMDELESNDGSDGEEEQALPPPRPPFAHCRSDSQETMRSGAAASSRSSIMRLGNHSTPSLRPPTLRQEQSEQFSDVDRKKPISNVPARPRRRSFFTSKKKGLKNIDIPLLPFRDVATSHGEGSSTFVPQYEPRRRPATADAEDKPRLPKRESVLRFEGMLDQYAQAERERIKRITTSMSSSQR